MWLYGGRPIPSGTNIATDEQGDLVILHSRYGNSGVYECVAKNNRGFVNETFNLTIIKDSARIIMLKIGKTTLHMHVSLAWDMRTRRECLRLAYDDQVIYLMMVTDFDV